MTSRLPALLDILDRADAQPPAASVTPDQLLADVQALDTEHDPTQLAHAVTAHLAAQRPAVVGVTPVSVQPDPVVADAPALPWRARLMLALGRWLILRAQQGQPEAVLTSQDETFLDAKERQALAVLRDAASRHSPLLSQGEDNRWAAAFFQVAKRRHKHEAKRPLTDQQKAQLGVVPRGQDPLISALFESNAFADRDRTALAALLYDWLDHPENPRTHGDFTYVDEYLFRYLIEQGINPDVPQGRVWLGVKHPRQNQWSIRQSCVYLHLDQAILWMTEARPPVPAKETDSLMWWATQAHFDIDYPTYWGYWATHEKQWARRFQATVSWILDHEKAAIFHAKLLRKAIAQKHPQAEWIGAQMAARGWSAH